MRNIDNRLQMKKLTLSLLGTILFVAGCASPYEAIFALEQIHRLPDEGEACVNRPAQWLLRYRASVPDGPGGEEEEVEDPVSFCRDRIAELETAEFDSPREKGAAISVLCLITARSPASLVRADALRAIRLLCEEQVDSFFHSAEADIDKEAWADLCARWKAFCKRESSTSLPLDRAAEREMTALLDEFGETHFQFARHAWETLSLLTFRGTKVDAGPVVTERLDHVINELLPETVYLTAREALFDSSELVFREAAGTLLLFRIDDIMPHLTGRMEICYDPPLKIFLLRALAARSLTPTDLGGTMMAQVSASLDTINPGVVFHAVELFKSLTGIDNNDPHFWKEWWSEYLNEHADALSGRG
jgi:hypothetical protein